MSGYTCRETYCSYGSYLRSRGYDAAICALFTDIEAGKVSVGPIVPNGNCGVTINGDVAIQGCNDPSNASNKGILNLYGGEIGTSSQDLQSHTHLGLQANRGAHIYGPILQTRGGHVPAATSLHGGGPVNVLTNTTYFSHPIHGNLTGTADKSKGFSEINILGSGAPTVTSNTPGELGEVKIAKEITVGPPPTTTWYMYILVEKDTTTPTYTWKKVALSDL
jgi:hypothetical protein